MNKKSPVAFSNFIEQLYNNYSINSNNIILIPEITFQITENCNLNCSYCYQINKTHNVMNFEIAKKFIDLLIENNKNTQQYLNTELCKGVILEFIGGEPLLEIDLIDQIIQYFRTKTILYNHPWQNNWRISICSNGTLYFDPKFQDFLKKYNDVLSFCISIDGDKKLHDNCRKFPDGSGSYNMAIKASRHYRKYWNKDIGTKMTLSPEHIQYMSDAVINLINENYNTIPLNCIFEKGWTNEHAAILYQQLKILTNYILNNNLEDKIYISMFEETFFHPKDITDDQNWCGGNGRMMAINWKGDIYPCLRYMESSLGPDIEPIKIGNVNTGIMTDAKCRDCINRLKQVNRLTQSTQECIECPIAEGCAWCQAYNYQDSGDFNHRATYICCMHKARSLANVYFWNSYYRNHNENKRFKIWLPDEEALKIIDVDELKMLKELQAPIE